MRDIIRRHNRLNGLVFSIAEFALIALLIGAFATYYLFHHRPTMAFIAWGVTLNSATVVSFGVWQLIHDRTSGTSMSSYFDRTAREQHRRENPHMLRDTMTLTLTAVLPFALLLAVLIDFLRHREQ